MTEVFRHQEITLSKEPEISDTYITLSWDDSFSSQAVELWRISIDNLKIWKNARRGDVVVLKQQGDTQMIDAELCIRPRV